MNRPDIRRGITPRGPHTIYEGYHMVEFREAVLFTVTSLITVLVMAFGIKTIQPTWAQFLLISIAAVTLVIASTNAAYLARAGQKDAPYSEELPVVREAVRLTYRPQAVVHYLGIIRTGRQIDRFALRTLRRAVTTERKHEQSVLRNPREEQARRKIQALLTAGKT